MRADWSVQPISIACPIATVSQEMNDRCQIIVEKTGLISESFVYFSRISSDLRKSLFNILF
ncbi:hypothetical protein [Metabacillus litoralis]|uniref:hypothetical protein n=1 Tax=Metabacillus TaxID=2675233 RepID=UPI001BA14BF0|nr:hypothetical protein [Metabacillus litoralis]MCM3164531.1 hypothetical protein [Metabacillus litoralis]